MKPTPERSKIHSLDGLRGVMAWWVVIGHISLAFGWAIPIIDRNGLAVDVFVYLSGFVIAMLIDRKRETYLSFVTRRALRIFPLYLIGLAISAALLPVQLAAWNYCPPTAANINRIELVQSASSHLLKQIAIHATLLQGLTKSSAFTIIGQAWSVSLEWQFYIIAPLLIWALNRPYTYLIVVVVIAAGIASAPHFTEAYLGAKLPQFLIGTMTYKFLHSATRFGWLAAMACLTGLTVINDGFWQLVPLTIWSAVITSSGRPAHSSGHALAKVLESRPLLRLGQISYSTYLLHMIMLYTTIWAFGKAGFDAATSHLLIAAATIAGTYAGSLLAFHLVERPGIDFGARLTEMFAFRRLNCLVERWRSKLMREQFTKT